MSVLYLIPAPLSENVISQVIPEYVVSLIYKLEQFIVEDIRSARRFLSKIKHPLPIEKIIFREWNEHSSETELASYLPYLSSANTGIISEAGVPAIADPGEQIILLAHTNNIPVIPLVGPSSILLALMASGLNGQSFSFVGYLPIKGNERQDRLRFLERRSARENQTQIFIETPYRNMQLLLDILKCCQPNTKLTIAAELTGKNQFIHTKTVLMWKKQLPELNRIPTVFLLQA